MKEIFDNIVNGLVRYVEDNKLKSFVLGLSGGIDSTLCAVLCREACNRMEGVELIGMSLPSKTNSMEENLIASMAGELCHKFSTHVISDAVGEIRNLVTPLMGPELTPLQIGNVKARIRMICLYNTASANKGVVIDTDNLTEHYLGFYTLHGDVGDLAPIASLWKTEVYELAKWCLGNIALPQMAAEALAKAIDITPTDGNGVKDGGDLAQIAPGLTYTEVDRVLKNEVETKNETVKIDVRTYLIHKYGKELIDGILNRYRGSEFKRKRLPVVIHAKPRQTPTLQNQECYDKEGKPIGWLSRSVAVVGCVFARDFQTGAVKVLVSQRGKGTPDPEFVGAYNCVCGYLDYNESGPEAIVREIREETGVRLPPDIMVQFGLLTEPSTDKRQNVAIRYFTVLRSDYRRYEPCFDTANSEPGEVSDIRFIDCNELGNYKWAFEHDKLIGEAFEYARNNGYLLIGNASTRL